MLARLARMGPDAVELARAVAVLGSRHEVAVAAELAGLDPAAAELIADELAAAQILAPVRPLDFFHPVIGEAVYAGIATGARRLAHRRAATILDRTGGIDSVAAHLLMTGPAGDRWVAQKLSAAARAARERGAPEVAASYLRRALAEPPGERERPELLLRLGEAEWYTGQPTAMARLGGGGAAREAPAVAAAAGALANAYVLSDQTDQAVRVLQQAIGRIGPADPQLALRLEGAAALAASWMTARRPPRTGAWKCSGRAGRHAGRAGAAARGRRRGRHATRRARQCGGADDQAGAGPSARPATERVHFDHRDPDRGGIVRRAAAAVRGHDDGRPAACRATGDDRHSQLLRLGAVPDGRAGRRRGAGPVGAGSATGIYALDSLAHLVEILIERDALDEAEAELAKLEPPVASHSIMAVTYLMARGQLRAAQGRARTRWQISWLAGSGANCSASPWPSITGARGRPSRTRRWPCRARRSPARRWQLPGVGRPRALGVALRCAGVAESLLCREAGDPAMAGSPASKRRSWCWRGRRRRSSWPAPSPIMARRCAGPGGAPRRAPSWSEALT